MKLRNRKTGEIAEWDFGNWYQHILNPDNKESYECTLSEFIDRTAKFREEWEDVPEEPKEYWYINEYGSVTKAENFGRDTLYDKSRKNFGNYFETEEEAELAVRKLEAWKRLKDKGFRITLRECKGNAWLQADWGNLQGDYSDVLFLFGGEE